MDIGTLLTAVCSTLLGSGGIAWLVRSYIERKLRKAEKEADERRRLRIREAEIEDELHHAYGRTFFWLFKFAESGEQSGELARAFADLEEAEEKRKEYLRQITAHAKTE